MKEDYEIIFQSNDERLFEQAIKTLIHAEIKYKIITPQHSPILGQNKELWEKEIWIEKSSFDLASSLMDELEISLLYEEEAKAYPELSDYYNKVFVKFDTDSTYFNITWNNAAFVFSFLWYFYQGMYIKGFILSAIQIGLFVWLKAYGFIFFVLIAFFCGMHGNYHKYNKYKARRENSKPLL